MVEQRGAGGYSAAVSDAVCGNARSAGQPRPPTPVISTGNASPAFGRQQAAVGSPGSPKHRQRVGGA